MTTAGWQQATIWLLGSRLPLGDPHDGFGRRPQIQSIPGPGGHQGLMFSDELGSVFFHNVAGSRLTARTWLKLTDDDMPQGLPLGTAATTACDDYRFAAMRLHHPPTKPNASSPSAPPANLQGDLIQCNDHLRVITLHENSQNSSPMCFTSVGRVLLNKRGVPATIHWRRDHTADLLLAQPDGSIRRWEGLDDAKLSPLPGEGKPVLAAGVPINFEGQSHLAVVDWNLRGRSDLLVSTAHGELWLYYDVGGEDHVRYDRGRCLSDAHGPIHILGGASATLLHLGQHRALVAADGQGQLWHWPLKPVTSWVVEDWQKAGSIEGGTRHVARTHEAGHWWLQEDENDQLLLRIGPPQITEPLSPHSPMVFPPLPPELVLESPCSGPCEVHVTLASLSSVMGEGSLPLDSMVDIRLDDQPQPRMISIGDCHDGPHQEIYWDTVDLTDRKLCLRGLHGGFLYEGGLPAAIVSVRIVPLTPQDPLQVVTSDEEETEDAMASAHRPPQVGGIELENNPFTSAEADADDAYDEVDQELEDEEETDDAIEEEEEDDGREPVKIAAMLDSFQWTSIFRTDSALEVDDLIARHQDAGVHRIYYKLGEAMWNFPSQVRSTQGAVPPDYSPEDEAYSRRQADHFEHINRLEMAAAACSRRGMELYAWLALQSPPTQEPGRPRGAVNQFLLDHPEYQERDIHGKAVPGKLCLGYQEVRSHLVQVASEALQMGATGLLIDAAEHLPRVQYGEPLVAEFRDRHQLDMRQLSPFDLRVVSLQCEVMGRFLKELREAANHAKPRLRAPIHLRVLKPYMLMGCDPLGWARDHLVDAIIIQGQGQDYISPEITTLAHALQDTYCEAGVGFARALWGDPARPLQPNLLSREVHRHLGHGAQIITFGDSTTLIRHRGLCQTLHRINQPGQSQPRAVLA